MDATATKPASIDAYIAGFSPEVRTILQTLRATIARAVPEAREAIRYQIPAFETTEVLVYFAAFKKHIGVYPPVRGDADLLRAVAPYAGEKGNLQFSLERPIPYELVARIAQHRDAQARARAAAKKPAARAKKPAAKAKKPAAKKPTASRA